MLATILHPGGETDTRELPEDEVRRLRLLQDLVGGHLEVVPVPGAKYLVFWEEAKDSPHVVNERPSPFNLTTTSPGLSSSCPGRRWPDVHRVQSRTL